MRRLVLFGVLGTVACGGGGGGGGGEEGARAPEGGQAAAVAPLGTATISGVVNFQGTPPANPPIDMSEEAECAAKYPGQPHDPVVKVTNGKLANVFVRITAGVPAGPYPRPAAPAVIDQVGCLYHPRVLGVMVNQPLEIRNSDPLSHNIKAVPKVNRGFNVSQPQAGMKTERVFTQPEIMIPFECSVHGWMHAWVGVVEHPYFATSGEDGTFTITGLPAGTYTLEAWHETLGTKTAQVTVTEGGSASVTFTYGS